MICWLKVNALHKSVAPDLRSALLSTMAASAAEKMLADDEGGPLLVQFTLMASPIVARCRLLHNTSERHDSYVDDLTCPHPWTRNGSSARTHAIRHDSGAGPYVHCGFASMRGRRFGC